MPTYIHLDHNYYFYSIHLFSRKNSTIYYDSLNCDNFFALSLYRYIYLLSHFSEVQVFCPYNLTLLNQIYFYR